MSFSCMNKLCFFFPWYLKLLKSSLTVNILKIFRSKRQTLQVMSQFTVLQSLSKIKLLFAIYAKKYTAPHAIFHGPFHCTQHVFLSHVSLHVPQLALHENYLCLTSFGRMQVAPLLPSLSKLLCEFWNQSLWQNSGPQNKAPVRCFIFISVPCLGVHCWSISLLLGER